MFHEKYFSLSCILLLLLICSSNGTVTAQDDKENLIQNPGFEIRNPVNGTPEGFIIGKDNGALAVIDKNEAHGGKQSVKIISGDNPASGSRIYYAYEIKAPASAPGKTYTCSIWSKLNIGEKKKSLYGHQTFLRVRCCVDMKMNLSEKGAVVSNYLKENHDWQEQTCTIRVPENTKYIMIDFGTSGAMLEAWFDDLRLVELKEPSKQQSE